MFYSLLLSVSSILLPERRQVVRTERYHAAILIYVQAALAQALDIQVAGVLEGHRCDCEAMTLRSIQEVLHAHRTTGTARTSGFRSRYRTARISLTCGSRVSSLPAAADKFPVLLRWIYGVHAAAALTLRAAPARQRHQRAVGHDHKVSVETAKGMVTGRRCNILLVNPLSGLHSQFIEELIQRKAILIRRQMRHMPQEADRLEVYAADSRRILNGKADDIPDLVNIYAGHQRRNKGNAEVRRVTVPNAGLLHFRQGASTKLLPDFVSGAVELQEYKGKPGVRQLFRISIFLRQTKTIRIQLHIATADLFQQ